MKTVTILLAAGNSTRFGVAEKLLADFKGMPLIAHAAQTVRDFAPDHLVAIIANAALIDELDGFTCIEVPQDQSSQSASLRAGIEFATHIDADKALIALADMPFISVHLLDGLSAKCTHDNAAATTDGICRSPPACFPRKQFATISKMQGDKGARALLAALPDEALISVDGLELVDIDSANDLAHYS